MIFRLSQKLNTKIKAGNLSEMPLAENLYADWSCHVFLAARNQYIILSNTKSLYSCLMNGKGITNEEKYIERAFSTIGEFMEDDGQAFVFQRFIAPSIATVSYAKALNRSVTGSMGQLIGLAELLLTEDGLSLHDVGFKLNAFLLSSLKDVEGGKYGKPREVFKNLVD